jgi:predicted MFS family arabinose efflux permease
MSVRTAAVQFGYLLGAALGGVALARGGYPALGATLSAMLAGSSLLHLWSARLARRSPTTAATRP